MKREFAIYVALHWGAVIVYIAATIANVWGVTFQRDRLSALAFRIMEGGWLVHTASLGYWWSVTGHGPYLARNEVLSADAWIALTVFLAFARLYPRIRIASLLVFPTIFLMLALAVFCAPQTTTLPPTFSGIWLVIHITFYKIALGTLIIALAFSIFVAAGLGGRGGRIPDSATSDLYAYRFASFGFIFWLIGMLAGSIWAYRSWGRFWGWDPVESWSLVTWVLFGIYLHLRRFFRFQGKSAAWFFVCCFFFSLVALFYTSHLNTSIHAEYFR